MRINIQPLFNKSQWICKVKEVLLIKNRGNKNILILCDSFLFGNTHMVLIWNFWKCIRRVFGFFVIFWLDYLFFVFGWNLFVRGFIIIIIVVVIIKLGYCWFLLNLVFIAFFSWIIVWLPCSFIVMLQHLIPFLLLRDLDSLGW